MEYELPNARLRAGKPVRITQASGHTWFPVVHRFEHGELVAKWSMMPDVDAFAYVAGLSHSLDEGRTWGDRYSMGQWGGVSRALPGTRSMRVVPYYFYPSPAGQSREFATNLITLHAGGRYEVEPFGVRISGFPRDVKISETGAAGVVFNGAIVQTRGAWYVTAYGWWAGESKFDLHWLESRDYGRTWRFISTIASWRDIEDIDDTRGKPPISAEGPCEASVVELADGELLAVYRLCGAIEPRWWFHQSRSRDGGRTWTKPVVLQEGVGRVEPSMQRLASGAIVLSAGRPGIYIYVNTDGRGDRWETFDLLEHHNRVCAAGETINRMPAQTTAYTELAVLDERRLVCVYDRCPLGWQAVPSGAADLNMIFAVELDIAPRG